MVFSVPDRSIAIQKFGWLLLYALSLARLAIYAARGLRSGTPEITAVICTACGGWQIFSQNEVRRLGIFQVASHVEASHHGAFLCQRITAISSFLSLEFWCSEGHLAQFDLILTPFRPISTYFKPFCRADLPYFCPTFAPCPAPDVPDVCPTLPDVARRLPDVAKIPRGWHAHFCQNSGSNKKNRKMDFFFGGGEPTKKRENLHSGPSLALLEVIIWSKFVFFPKHRLPKNTIKIGVSALFFWKKNCAQKIWKLLSGPSWRFLRRSQLGPDNNFQLGPDNNFQKCHFFVIFCFEKCAKMPIL